MLLRLLLVAAVIAVWGCGREQSRSAALPSDWHRISPHAEWDEDVQCANLNGERWRAELDSATRSVRFVNSDPSALAQRVVVPGGTLSGWNMGEFGGGVVFEAASGRIDTLPASNLVGFVSLHGEPVALVGIAHMGYDAGEWLQFAPRANSGYEIARRVDLGGEPQAALVLGADTILVLTRSRLLAVSGTGPARELARQDMWGYMGGHDLARDGAANVFIGMRAGVARLERVGNGYREEWFVPNTCSPADAPKCQCFK